MGRLDSFKRFATLPRDLVRRLIAPGVLAEGTGYLRNRGYEVVTKYCNNAFPLSASHVDWKRVADGTPRAAKPACRAARRLESRSTGSSRRSKTFTTRVAVLSPASPPLELAPH